MYSPKHFQLELSKIPDFINKYPLAMLVSQQSEESGDHPIIINYAPVMYDPNYHCLLGHLSNNNEQLLAMKDDQAITVIFNGEDGYISPSWYKDARQVPTWNFSKVEIKGRANLIEQDLDKLELITRLSEIHEQRINSDWKISKLPEAKLNAMLGAITGFMIKIDHWQGKAKLSQNKSKEERARVIENLMSLGDGNSVSLASAMKELG